MKREMQTELAAAVRSCLADCYGTHTPLSTLAEYADKLHQRGWKQPEIYDVEAAVLKILLAVSSTDVECKRTLMGCHGRV